jgi:hypothetical protein
VYTHRTLRQLNRRSFTVSLLKGNHKACWQRRRQNVAKHEFGLYCFLPRRCCCAPPLARCDTTDHRLPDPAFSRRVTECHGGHADTIVLPMRGNGTARFLERDNHFLSWGNSSGPQLRFSGASRSSVLKCASWRWGSALAGLRSGLSRSFT